MEKLLPFILLIFVSCQKELEKLSNINKKYDDYKAPIASFIKTFSEFSFEIESQLVKGDYLRQEQDKNEQRISEYKKNISRYKITPKTLN